MFVVVHGVWKWSLRVSYSVGEKLGEVFGGEREFSVRAKDLMRSVILEDLGFNSVSS